MQGAVHRSVLLLSIGGLSLLAWAALWWLESSPWGALFHAHGGAHAHHAPGALAPAAQAGLFVAGWVVMTIAMMLPTTLPLVGIFHRLTRTRGDQTLLVVFLLLGYLLVWTAFGGVALLLNAGIDVIPVLDAAQSSWATAAALFLVAGAFQFSRLKYQCLDKCRTPLSFVVSHWRGRAPRSDAFRLGMAHGVFCVGCCWALMLLMFAVSTASVLWMLALALLMAIEKNVTWGKQFARPLGVVLIAVGVLSVAYHLS